MSEQTMLHCSVHGRHTGTICPVCNIDEIAALRAERDDLKHIIKDLHRSLGQYRRVAEENGCSVKESSFGWLQDNLPKMKASIAERDQLKAERRSTLLVAGCNATDDRPLDSLVSEALAQKDKRLAEAEIGATAMRLAIPSIHALAGWASSSDVQEIVDLALASNAGRKITERLQAADRIAKELQDIVDKGVPDLWCDVQAALTAYNSLK